MAMTVSEDLRQFREFVNQQVDCQPVALSPEEVLDQWRAEHPLPDDEAASAAEIQESLEEMESGVRGVPARDAITEARRMLRQRVLP